MESVNHKRFDKIKIEQIAADEYDKRRKWIGFGPYLHGKNIQSIVINPISYPIDNKDQESLIMSYYNIILELMAHPLVSSVCVNDDGCWVRINKANGNYFINHGKERNQGEDLSLENIKKDPRFNDISKIVALDGQKFQYFEIRLGFHGSLKYRPSIAFAEVDTADGVTAVGCLVCFMSEDKFYFNVNDNKKGYMWNNAIWVPQGYESSPSMSERRKNNKNF